MPQLQESDFQITFLSGADTLPFTQNFLDTTVMKDHKALYNPEGKAYDGPKRQVDTKTSKEPMAKKQKASLETLDESLGDIKKKHKVLIQYGGGPVIIAALSPNEPPLALVFGQLQDQ